MPAEAGKDVAGDGRDFQGDEDEHQFDGRRHQAHADRAKKNQGVILAVINLLEGQIVERHQDGGQRNEQNHEMEEDAEVIDPQHVVEAEAGELRLRLVECGCNGSEHAEGGEDSEPFAAAARGQDRFHEHDDHAPDREDNFRKNADVVGGCWWHGYLSTVCTLT